MLLSDGIVVMEYGCFWAGDGGVLSIQQGRSSAGQNQVIKYGHAWSGTGRSKRLSVTIQVTRIFEMFYIFKV
jgi:hypothetical protein